MKLTFSHLDFSYSEQAPLLLHDFSLKVEQGDIMTLKGTSGAGKTTLFRLLLGFEKPNSGTINFEGEPLQGEVLKEFRNRAAWLPQDLDLGEGSLKDVFYFPFNFKTNRQKKPSENEVEKIFQFLGLQSLTWDDEFKSLSTGQRQRIGIAICHFLDKDILLLDEPTSALDTTSKEKIKSLLWDSNKIILSASHDDWWVSQSTKIVEINAETK